MCELFGFASLLPTRATFSLRSFAERGGFASASADGWGLAFLDGRDARLYKEPDRDAADFAKSARQHIVLLASVALSGENWSPLAEGESIVARDGQALVLQAARQGDRSRPP